MDFFFNFFLYLVALVAQKTLSSCILVAWFGCTKKHNFLLLCPTKPPVYQLNMKVVYIEPSHSVRRNYSIFVTASTNRTKSSVTTWHSFCSWPHRSPSSFFPAPNSSAMYFDIIFILPYTYCPFIQFLINRHRHPLVLVCKRSKRK